MSRYLLDTDVLIDYANGKEPAVSRIKGLIAQGDDLGLSAVAVAEFFAGLRPHQRELLAPDLVHLHLLGPLVRRRPACRGVAIRLRAPGHHPLHRRHPQRRGGRRARRYLAHWQRPGLPHGGRQPAPPDPGGGSR